MQLSGSPQPPLMLLLQVSMFDDFEKYAKVPDEYQVPEVPKFTPMENLHEWLLDKLGRDQFVARAGDETAVFWNDGKRNRCDEVRRCQDRCLQKLAER